MGDKKGAGFREIADNKYRPLKKSLKITYKAIVNQIEKGQLPSTSLITEFMAQTRAMVSYPGFGDSHYADFTQACDSLNQAFTSKDLGHFSEELKKISILKKECHHRYK